MAEGTHETTSLGDTRRIYVIRHGHTALDPMHRSDGFLDLPLSEAGQQGAVDVVNQLKHHDIRMIYSGTHKRHVETAEIIQSGLLGNPPIKSDPAANTWNLGLMAGDPKKPNKPIVKKLMEKPTVRPEGGETYREFGNRIWPFIEKRLADASKERGPQLVILSGSGCRYISTKLFGDRDVLDLDEDGCFVLYPTNKGFTAKVMWGHKDANDEEFS